MRVIITNDDSGGSVEFRQIQYFVCLYEEGSVTRAARRLNIVQPALSMQIAKLEEEIGQLLFVRSPQGMQPTAEGRQMYRAFLPVLGDFERAREHVMRKDGELTGHVRVGMIATIAQGILVDAMLEFSANHPQVELSLTDGFSGTLTDAVSIGQLDAAIINKPRHPVALSMEPISDEDLMLVTGPLHVDMQKAVAFNHLPSLKLVLPTRQHGLRGIIESFGQAENVSLMPTVEIDSISAILELVFKSDFCTLLPCVAVQRQLGGGGFRSYNVTSPKLTRQIVCITHPRRPPNPASLVFLSIIFRRIKDLSSTARIHRP